MAIAAYPSSPQPPPQPSPPGGGGGKPEGAPGQALVTAILERSHADVGWLAWGDGKDAVVIPGVARSFLNPAAIGEFPDPPRESLVIDRGTGNGPWVLWCRARAILSCAVSPIYARRKVVGVIGLASCHAGGLDDYEVDRLQLAATLAVHARTYEARLAGLRRM